MVLTPSKSHGRLSIGASLKPRELVKDTPSIKDAWTAQVLTLYPEMFPGTLGQSLIGTALKDGLWNLEVSDIRRFATGKHRNVDDTPAGGGAGMVLRADVLGRAIEDSLGRLPAGAPRICLSPRGKPFTQVMAQSLANGPGALFLAGRFEGFDQRVLDHYQFSEVSIGDYVLTGGEIATQVLIDATVRLIPRVLGNAESALEESFSDGLLEHPQYTRPSSWNGHDIPEILLSGHHANIAKWRHSQAAKLTQERRPDLWRAYLEDQDRDPIEDQEPSDAHITADKAGKKETKR